MSGTYMTSLNMPGFSLTLLLLPSGSNEPYSPKQILELLDAPANAPGWSWTSGAEPGSVSAKATKEIASAKRTELDMAREYSCFWTASKSADTL